MEKKYFIGIDLGGTRVKLGLICNGKILDKQILAANADQGFEQSLSKLKSDIDVLLKANHAQQSFAGLAMAFPGLVNPVTKEVLSTNEKYNDACGFDIQKWVEDNWQVPFFLENDARMAAVGEWKYGVATDTDNLVVVTLGTGIGTAAIIEGQLLRGRHYQAGCLGGHFSVHVGGRKCTCGNSGCAEAYGGGWSLPAIARESAGFENSQLSDVVPIDFKHLFQAAKHGDPLALQLRTQYIETWSSTVVNLIHAYDPEVVVMAGGAMNNREDIMSELKRNVQQAAWCEWGQVAIRASELMSDNALLGSVHCLQYPV